MIIPAQWMSGRRGGRVAEKKCRGNLIPRLEKTMGIRCAVSPWLKQKRFKYKIISAIHGKTIEKSNSRP
jgi:hypothetical protein